MKPTWDQTTAFFEEALKGEEYFQRNSGDTKENMGYGAGINAATEIVNDLKSVIGGVGDATVENQGKLNALATTSTTHTTRLHQSHQRQARRIDARPHRHHQQAQQRTHVPAEVAVHPPQLEEVTAGIARTDKRPQRSSTPTGGPGRRTLSWRTNENGPDSKRSGTAQRSSNG